MASLALSVADSKKFVTLADALSGNFTLACRASTNVVVPCAAARMTEENIPRQERDRRV